MELSSGFYVIAGVIVSGAISFLIQRHVEKEKTIRQRRELAVRLALAEWEYRANRALSREERGLKSTIHPPSFFLVNRIPVVEEILGLDFQRSSHEEIREKLKTIFDESGEFTEKNYDLFITPVRSATKDSGG